MFNPTALVLFREKTTFAFYILRLKGELVLLLLKLSEGDLLISLGGFLIKVMCCAYQTEKLSSVLKFLSMTSHQISYSLIVIHLYLLKHCVFHLRQCNSLLYWKSTPSERRCGAKWNPEFRTRKIFVKVSIFSFIF